MKDNVSGETAEPGGGAPTEQWLTTREAARRLGLPPRRLYDLIDQGTLAAYQVDEDIMLRPRDVDAYSGNEPSA